MTNNEALVVIRSEAIRHAHLADALNTIYHQATGADAVQREDPQVFRNDQAEGRGGERDQSGAQGARRGEESKRKTRTSRQESGRLCPCAEA